MYCKVTAPREAHAQMDGGSCNVENRMSAACCWQISPAIGKSNWCTWDSYRQHVAKVGAVFWYDMPSGSRSRQPGTNSCLPSTRRTNPLERSTRTQVLLPGSNVPYSSSPSLPSHLFPKRHMLHTDAQRSRRPAWKTGITFPSRKRARTVPTGLNRRTMRDSE